MFLTKVRGLFEAFIPETFVGLRDLVDVKSGNHNKGGGHSEGMDAHKNKATLPNEPPSRRREEEALSQLSNACLVNSVVSRMQTAVCTLNSEARSEASCSRVAPASNLRDLIFNHPILWSEHPFANTGLRGIAGLREIGAPVIIKSKKGPIGVEKG